MALSTTSILFNGERAVVFLFVARILFSIPASLFYEAVALVVLALAGLLVEITVDSSLAFTQFKTRAGVSSGLLLGAVTLPTVIISKLIQLRRAFSLNEVGLEEYLKVQYWLTSVSCFAVLVFLFFVIRWSSCASSCLSFCSSWYAKIILCCLLVDSTLCCMSLATITQDGMQTALKLLWVFCHGFAAVKLIQHLLHSFPSCASIDLWIILYF